MESLLLGFISRCMEHKKLEKGSTKNSFCVLSDGILLFFTDHSNVVIDLVYGEQRKADCMHYTEYHKLNSTHLPCIAGRQNSKTLEGSEKMCGL